LPRLAQRVFWALALLITALPLLGLINNMRPENRPEQHPEHAGEPLILDFFQEWASAKNHFKDLPVYTPQTTTAALYLGNTNHNPPIKVNAHPPSSVLLALPFAFLSYSDAFLVWNLISLLALVLSLWLVIRQLDIPFTAWSLLPTIVLLTWCNPFRQHIFQGQINLLLLPLFVGIWAADRSGRPDLAGVLLGLATAIKLFPGFLFVYYLLRRQWKVLGIGTLTVAAVTGLTAAVLGVDTYTSYVHDVLPQVQEFKDWWANISLFGFWSKLFLGQSGHVIPLYQSPILAAAGAYVSCALVIGVLSWVVWRARTRTQQDLAFALTLTTMLLVSPIAWDHYFVFLLVPLALLWTHLPSSWVAKAIFPVLIVSMWFPAKVIWDNTIPGPAEIKDGKIYPAYPIHSLTVLAYQFFTLLGIYLFLLVTFLRQPGDPDPSAESRTQKEPADLDRRLGLHPEPQAGRADVVV
jgi:hypothetical protein